MQKISAFSNNSTALQARFPEIYQEFFNAGDIISSAPATFSWTGEVATRFGGLGCTQALPRRVYLRWKKQPGNNITIAPITFFSNEEWKPLSPHEQDSTNRGIIAYFKAYEKNLGGNIAILSEIPFSHGLGVSTAIGAALVYAIHCQKNNLPPPDLSKPILTQLTESPDLIHRAWRVRCLISGRSRGYADTITSLLPSSYPVITASTERPQAFHDRFNDTQEISDLDLAQPKQIFAWRLNEFFRPHTTFVQWPLDIALLSLDIPTGGDRVMNFLRGKQDFLKELPTELLPKRMKNREYLSTLLPILFPHTADDIWQNYILIYNTISLKIIKDLWDSLTEQTSNAMRFLTNSIRHYQEALSLLTLNTPTHDDFIYELRQFRRHHYITEPYGAKMSSGSRSSCILIVTPHGGLQAHFSQLLTHLQTTVRPGITVEWTSWRDGFDTAGARLEHAPQLEITHPLMREAKTKLSTLDTHSADFVFDEIRGRVWCGGKMVTARELPSQKMAVTLFAMLLAAPDGVITNDQLPPSSYTSYRNELQSKVIGPLRRLAEKRLHKELLLTIAGSLTKFTISRGHDDVTMTIRQRPKK